MSKLEIWKRIVVWEGIVKLATDDEFDRSVVSQRYIERMRPLFMLADRWRPDFFMFPLLYSDVAFVSHWNKRLKRFDLHKVQYQKEETSRVSYTSSRLERALDAIPTQSHLSSFALLIVMLEWLHHTRVLATSPSADATM